MSFDLIIKNGTVILENEARIVDIAVRDGKIAAIGENLGDAKDVMDATGLVVSLAWSMLTLISQSRGAPTGKGTKRAPARRRVALPQ
jgi:formylmethanofuran dehydrogenase subunit A